MKLIIVPQWLEQTLTSLNLPLTTVTDVKKVFSITSAEDVSVYAEVNSQSLTLFGGVTIAGCFDIVEQALALEHARISAHMSYLSLKRKSNPLEHLIGRNYVEGAPLCYSCTVLDDEYIVITLGQHEVGASETDVLKAQASFMERLFGQHLLSRKLPDLAREPVFLNYLKGLKG